MAGIAIFDFDGTLFKKDSFLLFMKFAAGKSKLFKALGIYAVPLFLGKTGLIDIGKIKEKIFSYVFKGWQLEDFQSKGMNFSDIISENLNPEVWQALKTHQRNGDKIVIASASIGNWIRPWAQKEGIDMVISTEVQYKENLLTGKFSTPNCKGREKARRILQEIPGIMHTESWGYGDSTADEPMLELVSHPIRIKRNGVLP